MPLHAAPEDKLFADGKETDGNLTVIKSSLLQHTPRDTTGWTGNRVEGDELEGEGRAGWKVRNRVGEGWTSRRVLVGMQRALSEWTGGSAPDDHVHRQLLLSFLPPPDPSLLFLFLTFLSSSSS